MIFKKIYIYSLVDNKKIKEYQFNENGLNIILGVKKEATESNGVGKTTFIECMKIILGTSLTKDFKESDALKNKDIFIVMEVSIDSNVKFLGRKIAKPEYGYILDKSELSLDIDKWDEYDEDEYRIIIENYNYKDIKGIEIEPKFTQVKEYLMRDEKEGFNSIFLQNRNIVQNHRIISFLSMLPSNFEQEFNLIKKQNKELNKTKTFIDSLAGDIKSLKISKKKLDDEIKDLKKISNKVDINSKIDLDLDNYRNAKEELNEIERKIYKLNQIKRQYKKNIENLNIKIEEVKKLNDLEKFYCDLIDYFPEQIKKNYSEVSGFYNFMIKNRGNYFNQKAMEVEDNIEQLKLKKDKYQETVSIASKILQQTNIVDDINSIISELNEKNLELAEINVKIESYNKKGEINKKIKAIKKRMIELSELQAKKLEDYESNKTNLSDIFDKLVEITYEEKGLLEYELEENTALNKPTGRIKVECQIDSEGSHGRHYMKINMFDLTLLINRINNDYILNYLIHDGSYCKPDDKFAKSRLLKYVDEILMESGKGQYIITANIDEFNKADIEWFLSNGKVIANLDRDNNDENRFFGFKY